MTLSEMQGLRLKLRSPSQWHRRDYCSEACIFWNSKRWRNSGPSIFSTLYNDVSFLSIFRQEKSQTKGVQFAQYRLFQDQWTHWISTDLCVREELLLFSLITGSIKKLLSVRAKSNKQVGICFLFGWCSWLTSFLPPTLPALHCVALALSQRSPLTTSPILPSHVSPGFSFTVWSTKIIPVRWGLNCQSSNALLSCVSWWC